MAPVTPPFADVLNSYMRHVVRECVPEPAVHEELEKTIRSYVVNLQRENTSESEIYDLLAEMNPILGCPLAFYEEFVMKYDEGYKKAAKAQKKAEKEAETLAARALVELTNKRKCHELEQATRNKQTKASKLTTPSMKVAGNQAPLDITPGSYVYVAPDLSPGMCSYGGNGFVTEVDGDGILRMFTVKYNECGSSGGMTESDICYSRLTVVTSPFASPKLVRERRSPDVLNIQAPPPTATKVSSIQDILASGASRGKKKGWRAKELGVFQLGSRNERFQSLLREDTKELLGFLSGLSTTGSDPRQHNNKGRNGRYTKRKNKSNPFTISYLAKAWGVGRHFPLKNIKKGREQTKEEKKSNPTQLSVINSLDAAKIHFSAKNLFIAHRVEVRTNFEKVFAYDTHTRAERFHLFREEAKGEWVVAEPNLRKYWEALSRSKIARQPQIRDNIIEVMRANPAKSFDQIAQDIGDWCSARTIKRWIVQHSGYTTYAQRALPLLTAVQKQKHVEFATRLWNNWNLPRQKVLWINYDEKWFYGWVSRCNAKMCEVLGIEKTHTYLYHKCHINKVMAVAFTAYAFNSTVENGGHGVKLGLYRVQAARVAQRDVRESRLDENGNRRYDGDIIRMKGDAYLIDCNVTGSDDGTSNNPKFSLLALFRDQVFPKIGELVGPGGAYEGYLPVFQGDNAGPHVDGTFHTFVKDFCESNGWKWEPQAAQMPHSNNLDLAVFPMMSKRHSALLKMYSNLQAPHDEIWHTAEEVWANLGSAEIARGYILAYRIAAKVIEAGGENTFLQKQEFHSGVRTDFYDTPQGVAKKIVVVK
jgi:Transposase